MPLKNQKEKIRASPWKMCFDFFLLIGGGVPFRSARLPELVGSFGSLATQLEPVLLVAGGGIVAVAEPNVRGDLAKLVADVGEDGGVRGVLHHEAGLAVEPARLHANAGGDGLDATEPAAGEGAVAVKCLALPYNPLQVGSEPRVLAVGVEDGATGGAEWAAAEGALAEKGLPATGCRLVEGRGRGAGKGPGREGEGRDGSEECFHA